jgi:CheY-like chemotaxis protein
MSQTPTTATPAVDEPTPETSVRVLRHILIADGDERSRERRRLQLHSAGYTVSLARTGFETIVKASCHVPDMIVLDDSLGPSEVAETARMLSTCPVTASIPILRVRAGGRVPRRLLSQPARASL